MNKVRERKLEARARRQESFNNKYSITAEKTIIQVPQPKSLIKNEIVKAEKNKSPVITESTKRGRGRPPKVVSEKINSSKALTGKKTVKGKGKK